MMNAADDETQITSSFESNLKLSNSSNTNNLISEAFNLNTSITNVKPFTVLPPSSNHFQPIAHSRTPSNDLNKTQTPPLSTDNKKINNDTTNLGNASSFFDQINKNTLTSSLVSPPNPLPTKLSPVSFQSPTTPSLSVGKPLSNSDVSSVSQSTLLAANKSTPPILTSQNIPTATNPVLTNIMPPSSIPPPPTSSAPPPSTIGSLANPYSARGALNKKVYDNNVVSVAPLAPTVSASSPSMPIAPIPTTIEQSASNLYMPPPTTITPQIYPTSTSNNQTYFDNSSTYSQGPPQVQQMNTDLSFQIGPSTHYQQSYDQNSYSQDNSNGQNKTMWNWFNSKLVNTFVEKAKDLTNHGVESIVTTIDPQMKDYMHPANKPILLVSSTSNLKVLNTIRESFNYAGFSKLTINAIDAQNSSQFAPQIVGYACALQSAKEKLDNTLMQLNQLDCIVISFQDFLAELSTDSWFELAVIMLKDRANNIDLTIFTEAIPVSNENISQLQQLTPNDYPFKYSGFSYRLPEKNFNFNPNATYITYDTADNIVSQVRISNALKTLAFLFKNRLLSLQTN